MRVTVIVAGLVLAGTAQASEQSALDDAADRFPIAYQEAATALTFTYQCAGTTGDHDAYDAAKADARERLPIAAADQMIAIVEAQEQVGEPVTEQLCVDLLRLME